MKLDVVTLFVCLLAKRIFALDHENKKPNVLLIMADDVGTEDVPGYWGNHIVDMPNLKKLQAKGVTFMDAHGTPKCAPSRYMLLSGNYHHRGRKVFGSWGFEDEDTQFLPRQKSIAELLQGQGYKTGMLGKWQ